jgi:HK97 family phage major capsid protein
MAKQLTVREKQYNAAGEALAKIANVMREASDEDLPKAEADFRAAQVEFDRCKKNLDLDEEVRGVPEFKPRAVENPNLIGMDVAEAREFSFVKAIRALMSGDWKDAGLEREASAAVAKALGKEARGFYVPMDVQQQRALTTGDATYAGNLVATDVLGGSFIEMLRNRLAVKQAGATILGGLVGNVAIPRQTGAGTFYWVGATTNAVITGESYPTVDQVTMTPHVGGAYTDVGRSLILQASIDVEAMVRRDLANICALGVDLAGLSGVGTTVYPKGIAAQDNVGSVVGGTNGAAPTWANMVSLETEVATDNADVENMAYIVNAKTRGYLKSTPKVATYSAEMMWDTRSPLTPLNGYKAVVSNQARSNLTKASGTALSEIFFGNWADLIIGQWGTLDIMVDPYTGATAGTVRLIALEDVDVCVRHGESFSRMADAVC